MTSIVEIPDYPFKQRKAVDVVNEKNKKKFKFCLIGCSSSENSLTNTIDQINQNVTNLMQSAVNSSSSNCSVVNNLTLDIDENIGCSINTVQNGFVSCKLDAIFSSTNNLDFNSIANQAIDQAANGTNKTVSDFLSTSSSSSSNNITNAAYIKNLVEKNISSSTQSSCLADATVVNNQTIHVKKMDCTKNQDAVQDFSQTGQVNSVSSCLSQAITDLLTNDSTLQQASQKTTASNDTQQKGLGDFISDLLSGLTRPLIIGIIGIVVLLVVCCIGLVVFGKSDAGQKLASQAGDAAIKQLDKK